MAWFPNTCSKTNFFLQGLPFAQVRIPLLGLLVEKPISCVLWVKHQHVLVQHVHHTPCSFVFLLLVLWPHPHYHLHVGVEAAAPNCTSPLILFTSAFVCRDKLCCHRDWMGELTRCKAWWFLVMLAVVAPQRTLWPTYCSFLHCSHTISTCLSYLQ